MNSHVSDPAQRQSNPDNRALEQVVDTEGSALVTSDENTLEGLLRAAQNAAPELSWAAYRSGEHLQLLGQGDAATEWPALIPRDGFEAFCREHELQRWVTGHGESALGWLLTPARESKLPTLQVLPVSAQPF
jgi:hypothetical protein